MFDYTTAFLVITLLISLVLLGFHVAIALAVTSAVGIYMATGSLRITEAVLASTSAEALRSFTFAVIPLFMLMGEFMGRSGVITDIYIGINKGLRRVPARLAIATVLGNTVFSFVTGVSIASAAAFSRIAYPEMRAHGYNRAFALGAIAGSSCLGMLIPPSVLMIVWGILTEQSIGRLFLAGVAPGVLLATFYVAYIVIAALLRPSLVGEGPDAKAPTRKVASVDAGGAEALPEFEDTASKPLPRMQLLGAALGLFGIVASILGGIWMGLFTPTEGAGAGAALALGLAVLRGMRWSGFVQAIFSVGRIAAPILILLLTAALYSRTLAMTGVTSAIRDGIVNSGLSPFMVMTAIIVVWFLLGMIIDSISIMLLTVPIVEPVAMAFGFDQLSFAIVGIIAIEAGLLTPPFGLLVYTVKASINDPEVGVQHIFLSAAPYWLVMLLVVLMLICFPQIANFFPNLMM
ncbi:TRAP transporter large permease [Pseudooceanicola algae]|uniref:C4-dicarboxylate TRAP transporter large permease protein DctM n=1 Tax=Pseudooceanicola algae TaxID=1537215 RepID=A0A418SHX0_9RHOB|nr:TRAP transporter large permease subunit [Pseudooceanicola algae]QPM90486.1 C4-dicarboxylate TRAP transporter large permease protein DctM [Pseudooceanicola algae]